MRNFASQDRFMGLEDAPSSWKIVKLVLLRKLDVRLFCAWQKEKCLNDGSSGAWVVFDIGSGRGTGGRTCGTTKTLDREGFTVRPEWTALRDGARPPVVLSAELGEWQHGWQYHASSASEHHFREAMVLSPACPSDQAHLRSHSGPGSSGILLGAPIGAEFRVLPEHFRTLVEIAAAAAGGRSQV